MTKSSDEHVDFTPEQQAAEGFASLSKTAWTICRNCGAVKPLYGWLTSCRGKAKLSLRAPQEEGAPQVREESGPEAHGVGGVRAAGSATPAPAPSDSPAEPPREPLKEPREYFLSKAFDWSRWPKLAGIFEHRPRVNVYWQELASFVASLPSYVVEAPDVAALARARQEARAEALREAEEVARNGVFLVSDSIESKVARQLADAIARLQGTRGAKP